jgi:hypothetical protein
MKTLLQVKNVVDICVGFFFLTGRSGCRKMRMLVHIRMDAYAWTHIHTNCPTINSAIEPSISEIRRMLRNGR